jgi:ribosomal protein S27AE
MSTTTRPTMICPKCGSEMNEHAEKLLDPTSPQEAADPALGGLLEEFHTCPNCGANASRQAID